MSKNGRRILSLISSLTALTYVACGNTSSSDRDAAPGASGSAGQTANDGGGANDDSGGSGGCDEAGCGPEPGSAGAGRAAGGGDPNGGGEPGAGGQGGSSSSEPSCEVVLLVQRSGSMFEQPAPADSYMLWLREALITDGGPAPELLSRATTTLSFFLRSEQLNECPTLRSEQITSLQDFEDAFDTARSEHMALTKADAPVAAAVSAAAGSLASSDNAHIVLLVTGAPDTCGATDGPCGVDPAIAAVQDAASEGVATHVVAFGDDPLLDALAGGQATDGYETYLQQLANAGAGQPVAPQPMFEYIYDGGVCSGLQADYAGESGNASPYPVEDAAALATTLTQLFAELCD